jgi:hypothetical protein
VTNRTSSTSEPAPAASDRPTGADGERRTLWLPVELARIDVRRGVRWARAQDVWLLYGLVSAVGVLIGAWVAFDLGRDLGRALAGGDTPSLSLATLSLPLGTVWLLLAGVSAVDAIGSNGDVENDGHHLTILPAATLVRGKLLASATKFMGFLILPVTGGFLGVSLGAGTPLPLVGGALFTVVAVNTATAVGYPIGLALKGAIRRSATLSRLKPLVAVVIGTGYVVVMATGTFTRVVDWLAPLLRAPPLGWLADLAFLTTGGLGATPIGALGAGVTAVAVVVGGSAWSVPAARYAWSGDRARTTSDVSGRAEPPSHPVDSVLGAVSSARATRAIAFTTLQRVYRSPIQLVFVAFPLVAAIPIGERVLATGALPWYAPWLVVWYGAWAAGAAVPLNPLGTQGATLPALLTAPADGRQTLHGTLLAAVLPAVPTTAGAAVALGGLDGRPVTDLAVLGVGAVVGVLGASVLAAGVGSAFPRFEAIDLGSARRAVPPSKVAYSVFSTALSLTVVAAAVVVDDAAGELVALLLSTWLPIPAIGVSTVRAVGWPVLAVAGLAVPVAYATAVRRIDRYRVE